MSSSPRPPSETRFQAWPGVCPFFRASTMWVPHPQCIGDDRHHRIEPEPARHEARIDDEHIVCIVQPAKPVHHRRLRAYTTMRCLEVPYAFLVVNCSPPLRTHGSRRGPCAVTLSEQPNAMDRKPSTTKPDATTLSCRLIASGARPRATKPCAKPSTGRQNHNGDWRREGTRWISVLRCPRRRIPGRLSSAPKSSASPTRGSTTPR